jgi:hypothetical protein
MKMERKENRINEKVEKENKQQRSQKKKARKKEQRGGKNKGNEIRWAAKRKKPDGKKGTKKSATTARRQLFSNWTPKSVDATESGNPFGAHFIIGIRTLKSHVAHRPRN